jgi:hypothetical protein
MTTEKGRRVHQAVAAAAIAVVLIGSIVTIGRASRAEPTVVRAGDAWTLPAAEAEATVSAGRPLHIVLYTPDCRWCARQLPALQARALEPGGPALEIIILEDEARARAALQPYGLAARARYVPRQTVEAHAGPVVTPMHILVGANRRVSAVHRGYLDTSGLAALTRSFTRGDHVD